MPARAIFNEQMGHLIIGSFQAKTYFAELLRKVEGGSVVTITRNGHDVAVMQSPRSAKNTRALEAWKRLTLLSEQISSAKSASGGNRNQSVTMAQISEWKNDGRK